MNRFDELVFDSLELRKITVTIAGQKYTLREATGADSIKYRDAISSSIIMSSEGKVVGMRGMASTDLLLVSLCLLDQQDKNVPVDVIKTWPQKYVAKLIKTVKDISELEDTESPVRRALLAAFTRKDSFTSIANFREWVSKLAGEDKETYEPLLEMVKPTPEELAKNGLSAMTGGSV